MLTEKDYDICNCEQALSLQEEVLHLRRTIRHAHLALLKYTGGTTQKRQLDGLGECFHLLGSTMVAESTFVPTPDFYSEEVEK